MHSCLHDKQSFVDPIIDKDNILTPPPPTHPNQILSTITGTGMVYLPNENNFGITAAQSSLYSSNCIGTFPRYNLDKVEKSYGKNLFEFCSETPMRILNGRKLGELLGYHTCYQNNGPVWWTMFWNLTPLSDHTPVALYLKVNSFVSYADATENLIPKPTKLKWDLNIKDRFQTLNNSNICLYY